MICERKLATRLKVLCEGLAPEFKLYMDYIRGLGFDERPDYDLLRGMFQ